VYEYRILAIADKLLGWMDLVLIDGALDFLEHNEARDGFEMLCDNICEVDVALTEAEYMEMVSLGYDFGLDLHGARFKCIDGLRT